jgi:dihydrolipoamide dehydrogenase
VAEQAREQQYDVLVVGAGPGGYVAAIRAAQLGFKTALIEKRDRLGGTCLNVGCIPSKALLDSSELYATATSKLKDHGITADGVRLDLDAMQARKRSVVEQLTGGVAQLMKGRKVTVVHGTASLVRPAKGATPEDAHTVKVSTGSGEEQLQATHVILATGSVPIELPFMPFDGTTIISSTEALELASVPDHLVVVGAGAIGLELGSVWARLGSRVTVVEIMPEILPGWDHQVAKTMRRELSKQGMEFLLEHKVTGATAKKGSAEVTVDPPAKQGDDTASEPITLSARKVLVAVGRRAYLDQLGIEEYGVKLDTDGRRVAVDEHYRTSVNGVYAIGDVIHGPMLAHKAEDEGIAAVERIAGIAGHVSYNTIPGVVYTHPEAASVGMTEAQLKEAGTEYRRGTFSFAANGRALALGQSGGFVKILADAATDRVLGAHVVGPWASDLIAELTTVMEFAGSAEDVARIVHAHPTLPEAVREAALAVDRRAIHSL